jgi:hypothetical protein
MSTQEEWKAANEKRNKDFCASLEYYGISKTLAYKSDQGWYWELHCKCCGKGFQGNSIVPTRCDAAFAFIMAVGITGLALFMYFASPI